MIEKIKEELQGAGIGYIFSVAVGFWATIIIGHSLYSSGVQLIYTCLYSASMGYINFLIFGFFAALYDPKWDIYKAPAKEYPLSILLGALLGLAISIAMVLSI